MTWTNSAPDAGKVVIEKTGLARYFERQFSVDAVKRFKPAAETYGSVASALDVDAGSLRLVAAHTWETLGAMAAGWRAALVTRPGNAASSVGEQPVQARVNDLAQRFSDHAPLVVDFDFKLCGSPAMAGS